MGLDMYLRAERAFDADSAEAANFLAAAGITAEEVARESGEYGGFYLSGWEHQGSDVVRRYQAAMDAVGLPFTTDSPGAHVNLIDGVLTVAPTVVYWRKANAIHNWFVTECQDGVDKCQETEVSPEALAHLAKIAAEALDAYNEGDLDRAAETLAPTAGCFFGSTEVDEWWAMQAQRTAIEVEAAVRNCVARPGKVRFIYQSSW